jgi:YVTN family beta-propeller protein
MWKSVAVLSLTVACGSTNAPSPVVPSNLWLRPVAVIPLPTLAGRIDHLAFDAATRRLFVAALGNDTVEVVDTATGTHLRSIPGFHEPQGIAVVPDLMAVAIANGDSGTLQLLDATTLQTRWTVNIGGDADNVRYDAGRKQLYVAAQGGLSIVNPASREVVQRIDIPGHPESFQLERDAFRVYANLPGASQVVVADRQSMSVRNRWATGACQANYPMALDETTQRLFIGCRRPATVTVLDTGAGKVVASTAVVGDTDDMFYDSARKRLYVIGGEGFIDVLQRSGDELRRVDRIATRDGARTGLWVADQNRLYLAVPARRGQAAEVRVFEAPR